MREQQEELYAAEVGAAALDRQRLEARDRYECCGELEADGHHIVCSKRPKDDIPAVLDGQLPIG